MYEVVYKVDVIDDLVLSLAKILLEKHICLKNEFKIDQSSHKGL